MSQRDSEFWVYVLENQARRFYIGSTDELHRRLAEHNEQPASGGRYAVKHGLWRLVWFECHPTRSAAMRREMQIKRMKSARGIKENLLAAQTDQPG